MDERASVGVDVLVDRHIMNIWGSMPRVWPVAEISFVLGGGSVVGGCGCDPSHAVTPNVGSRRWCTIPIPYVVVPTAGLRSGKAARPEELLANN